MLRWLGHRHPRREIRGIVMTPGVGCEVRLGEEEGKSGLIEWDDRVDGEDGLIWLVVRVGW